MLHSAAATFPTCFLFWEQQRQHLGLVIGVELGRGAQVTQMQLAFLQDRAASHTQQLDTRLGFRCSSTPLYKDSAAVWM